jgi:hypothetical protein
LRPRRTRNSSCDFSSSRRTRSPDATWSRKKYNDDTGRGRCAGVTGTRAPFRRGKKVDGMAEQILPFFWMGVAVMLMVLWRLSP